MQRPVKRTCNLDDDLMAAFDRFIDRTRMQRSAAVSVGLWLLMHLDPVDRQRAMDLIDSGVDSGEGVVTLSSAAPGAEGLAEELAEAVPPPERTARAGPRRSGRGRED